MALSKALLGSITNADTSSTTVAVTGLNTTGYTHVVFFVKHEGSTTTISGSDNKGSGAYNQLTLQAHSNGDLHGRLLWVKLGSPGTSTDVTATFGASVAYRRMAVWGVTSGTSELALDVEDTDQGNVTTVDAGSLVTTAATASFQGTGEYTVRTYTPGTGWTEDLDSNIHAQSRTDASGTLDPVCTLSSAMEWVTCAASFKESGSAPKSILIPRHPMAHLIGR